MLGWEAGPDAGSYISKEVGRHLCSCGYVAGLAGSTGSGCAPDVGASKQTVVTLSEVLQASCRGCSSFCLLHTIGARLHDVVVELGAHCTPGRSKHGPSNPDLLDDEDTWAEFDTSIGVEHLEKDLAQVTIAAAATESRGGASDMPGKALASAVPSHLTSAAKLLPIYAHSRRPCDGGHGQLHDDEGSSSSSNRGSCNGGTGCLRSMSDGTAGCSFVTEEAGVSSQQVPATCQPCDSVVCGMLAYCYYFRAAVQKVSGNLAKQDYDLSRAREYLERSLEQW